MCNNLKAVLIKTINLIYRYMSGFFAALVIACGVFSIIYGSFNAEKDLGKIFIVAIAGFTLLFTAVEILKRKSSLQNKLLIVFNSALSFFILFLAKEFIISCLIHIPLLMLFLAAFFVITRNCVVYVLVERKDIIVRDEKIAAYYDGHSEAVDVYLEDIKYGI